KDLYVERFGVDKLVIRAARDGDGRWDFQDILDKLSADDPNAPPKPSDPSGNAKSGAPDFLKGLRIASVKIADGRVELNDAMLGRPLAVGALNIDVSDVELGKPLAVKIGANLEDGAKKSPVAIDTKLAVLPADLSFD